jgi:hypothetical protein
MKKIRNEVESEDYDDKGNPYPKSYSILNFKCKRDVCNEA